MSGNYTIVPSTVSVDDETIKTDSDGKLYATEILSNENSLSILLLENNASLTSTDYDSSEVDLFTTANGINSSLHSTDMTFSVDKYTNLTAGSSEFISNSQNTFNTNLHVSGTILTNDIFLSKITTKANANATATVNIYKNSILILTKNVALHQYSGDTILFTENEYSSLFQNGDTWKVEILNVGVVDTLDTGTKTTSLFNENVIAGNLGREIYFSNKSTTQIKYLKINTDIIYPAYISLYIRGTNLNNLNIVAGDGTNEQSFNLNEKTKYTLTNNISYFKITTSNTDLTEIKGFSFNRWL